MKIQPSTEGVKRYENNGSNSVMRSTYIGISVHTSDAYSSVGSTTSVKRPYFYEKLKFIH